MTNREIDQILASRTSAVPTADRVKAIENFIEADLKPVRPLAPESLYLAFLAGVFVVACLASFYFIPGVNGWKVLSNLQRPAVFAPLLLSAGVLAFFLVRQMTPGAAHTRDTAAWGAGLLLLLAVLVAVLFRPQPESTFLADNVTCFIGGMKFAIPAGVATGLVLIRGAGLMPRLAGAAAGALAGLAGLAVLEIHCPILNVYHIVVAHISVVLACSIGGFFLGGVTFSRRLPK